MRGKNSQPAQHVPSIRFQVLGLWSTALSLSSVFDQLRPLEHEKWHDATMHLLSELLVSLGAISTSGTVETRPHSGLKLPTRPSVLLFALCFLHGHPTPGLRSFEHSPSPSITLRPPTPAPKMPAMELFTSQLAASSAVQQIARHLMFFFGALPLCW